MRLHRYAARPKMIPSNIVANTTVPIIEVAVRAVSPSIDTAARGGVMKGRD
jgi:hypothetical protein